MWRSSRSLGAASGVRAATRAPLQGVRTIRWRQQVEDRNGAIGFVRPHPFGQSGRIGVVSEKIDPDPPAEPYVRLSSHTALHHNLTI